MLDLFLFEFDFTHKYVANLYINGVLISVHISTCLVAQFDKPIHFYFMFQIFHTFHTLRLQKEEYICPLLIADKFDVDAQKVD